MPEAHKDHPAFTQQYKPGKLVQIQFVGEEPEGIPEQFNLAITDQLPRIGESIIAFFDDTTVILEVVDVLHWAVSLPPGEVKFPGEEWVDVQLFCKARSVSWHKEKLER